MALSAYTLTRPLQSVDGDLLALSSPTTLLGSNNSSAVTNTAIGFTWTFNGTAYTTLPRISSQGFIRLDSTTNLTNNTDIDGANAAVVLAPWWDDMVTSSALATGGVYLELQGSAPNRRLVIEWRCDTSWNSIWFAYSERIKFQAVLYETSGKLEYRYGTAAAVAGIPYGSPGASASCGVKVSTSVSQPGNIRDFFGASGSPAGSTGPFLTNLTVFRGGGSAIMWPADASNTTGLGAYNLHFEIVPVDPTYDYDGAPLCVASKSYETTGTVEVTVGSDTDTWTIAGNDAKVTMYRFGLWLHNPSRPWYPKTWQLSLVRDATTAGAKLSITGDAAWTWESAGSNPLGLPTTAPSQAVTQTATSPADGTWSPAAGIDVRQRQIGSRDGDAANGTAVMPQAPGTAVLLPQIESVATPLETARLSGCLAGAATRRLAQVRDPLGTWYTIALGEVARTAAGKQYYRLRLSAAIEV
jgi:hypothetical protein